MIILGIETSCDETAASVVRTEKNSVVPLSNIVSSQVKLHAKWGGVVPNLAAREHLKNIIPVISQCLDEAKVTPADIDLMAVTSGPGLIPALLVGVNAAKTLSYLWKKPLIGIHHIEGHIYANFISHEISVISNFQFPISKQISISNDQISKPASIKFPILCLVVSGGHTQLVLMKKHLDYKIIGETVDDAAGEAFDKVARILGLGYPGGPILSKLADSVKGPRRHIPLNTLPRPMLTDNSFNFSFSGLKTAVLYMVKKDKKKLKNKRFVAELAAEFQQASIDVLVAKTISAARIHKPKTISLAGGVSANTELRTQLREAAARELPGVSCSIPGITYSGDNAVMIAAAAFFRQKYARKKISLENWKKVSAEANIKL